MGWFRDLGREKPWAQGCLIFVAGVILAVSGCFGFLVTLNFNGSGVRSSQEALNAFGAVAFGLGGLATVVGFIWWIVGLARSPLRRGASSAPSVVPPPPPPPPPAPEG